MNHRVSSAILSMASASILIGTCHQRSAPSEGFTDLHGFPARNDFMASTGNDGSVQLWKDSKKLDNGRCQCDSTFFGPMSSHFAYTSTPALHTMWHAG